MNEVTQRDLEHLYVLAFHESLRTRQDLLHKAIYRIGFTNSKIIFDLWIDTPNYTGNPRDFETVLLAARWKAALWMWKAEITIKPTLEENVSMAIKAYQGMLEDWENRE